MKLIIFPGNFVPHIGGLETHVDEFSKYYSKYASITIFTPKVKNSLEKEIRHNNVKVIRYPAIQIGRDIFLPNLFSCKFWKLYKKIKKENFNFSMTRTRFFPNTLLGFIFSKCNKIKNIHVEHGSGPLITKNKLINFIGKIYDLTISKIIIKKSYKTISISKAVHDFLLKRYKIETKIITRGLDFDKYKVKEKKLEGKIKIGFVGRLTKWKGLLNSVEAFNQLNHKDAIFYIIGDGELYKDIKGKNIKLLGRKSFKETIQIMKNLDIYVHSSYPGGGLSNSLLQAMYCECMIIASPNEGAKEVINNERGILLKDNSVSSIKEGLKKVLSGKISKNKKAKEFIIKNFDWKDKVKEYKKMLK